MDSIYAIMSTLLALVELLWTKKCGISSSRLGQRQLKSNCVRIIGLSCTYMQYTHMVLSGPLIPRVLHLLEGVGATNSIEWINGIANQAGQVKWVCKCLCFCTIVVCWHSTAGDWQPNEDQSRGTPAASMVASLGKTTTSIFCIETLIL